MAQHRRANDPGTGRVSANMPDLRNQAAPHPTAQHHAQGIGGHQGTTGGFAGPRIVQAQRQVGHQHHRSQLHHRAGQIQRAEGLRQSKHGADSRKNADAKPLVHSHRPRATGRWLSSNRAALSSCPGARHSRTRRARRIPVRCLRGSTATGPG